MKIRRAAIDRLKTRVTEDSTMIGRRRAAINRPKTRVTKNSSKISHSGTAINRLEARIAQNELTGVIEIKVTQVLRPEQLRKGGEPDEDKGLVSSEIFKPVSWSAGVWFETHRPVFKTHMPVFETHKPVFETHINSTANLTPPC
ncbi:hypothetical protein RRG08_060884 [Elysia crispata]|uniref:Uncharacterized protein n=1 Tax=Elysia crispata TaxID=231223 RepID=A0AAE1DGE2_9GAST|nr:hypothetical protein RRG08_060884 [Elysia crispata]